MERRQRGNEEEGKGEKSRVADLFSACPTP